jgi:hypothetical protein
VRAAWQKAFVFVSTSPQSVKNELFSRNHRLRLGLGKFVYAGRGGRGVKGPFGRLPGPRFDSQVKAALGLATAGRFRCVPKGSLFGLVETNAEAAAAGQPVAGARVTLVNGEPGLDRSFCWGYHDASWEDMVRSAPAPTARPASLL